MSKSLRLTLCEPSTRFGFNSKRDHSYYLPFSLSRFHKLSLINTITGYLRFPFLFHFYLQNYLPFFHYSRYLTFRVLRFSVYYCHGMTIQYITDHYCSTTQVVTTTLRPILTPLKMYTLLFRWWSGGTIYLVCTSKYINTYYYLYIPPLLTWSTFSVVGIFSTCSYRSSTTVPPTTPIDSVYNSKSYLLQKLFHFSSKASLLRLVFF